MSIPFVKKNVSVILISISCRVCNGTQSVRRSFLHFPDFVFARSLPEMFAARHYVVEIASGCAVHTVFAVPVAPHVSLPGWRPVPRALGWPSAMHATAACDHSGVVLSGGCMMMINMSC